MCGIAGIIYTQHQQLTHSLAAMTGLLRHRGPDDEGYCCISFEQQESLAYAGNDTDPTIKVPRLPVMTEKKWNIGLGFRRYAVIDRTSQGHQPMESKGVWVIFNGEIYNYTALRAELAQDFQFSTNTDTEVLLAAWHKWGTNCFERLRGAFAVILADIPQKRLIIARDHFGKSPMYWYRSYTQMVFSSDILPILKIFPEQRQQINECAVADYLHSGKRDRNNQTFWKSITSVPPGCWCEIDTQTLDAQVVPYWSLSLEMMAPTVTRQAELQQIETFRWLLSRSIGRRMVGDRPVGLTLSGGMDSSSIAGVWAADHFQGQPLHCFTVCDEDPTIDETPFAQAVVGRHPDKLRHHIIKSNQINVWNQLDGFLRKQEEPFHDPVMVVDHEQLQVIKTMGIDIVLHGAAGDEVLAGYSGFTFKPHLYKHLWQHDKRSLMAELPFMLRSESDAAMARLISRLLPFKRKQSGAPLPFHNLEAPAPVSHTDIQQARKSWLTTDQMNYWLRSQKHFWQIPIEPRAPFLDVDLVEFSMALPPQLLIRHGQQKYILRKAVEHDLPPEVCWRSQKTGFPFDTAKWLQQSQTNWKNWLQTAPDTPWIDAGTLHTSYDYWLKTDAQMLWRCLCLMRWYQLMVV